MTRKERFYNDMVTLESVIKFNKANGHKTGPITLAMYKRLCKVFSRPTILLVAFVLFNSLAFSQDKKQCAGITKAGTQCKHKVSGMYCVQHDSNAIHCSDTTKAGKQCSRPVKKEGDKCFQHNKSTTYLYNAYSPEYDENFVIKSFSTLRNDTLVHFDNNVVATSRNTPYTAKIISLYNK